MVKTEKNKSIKNNCGKLVSEFSINIMEIDKEKNTFRYSLTSCGTDIMLNK